MNSVRAYLLALVATSIVLATCGFVLVLTEAQTVSRRQAAAHAQETANALSQAVDGELQRADGVLAALRASDAVHRQDWPAVDRQARAAFDNINSWVVVQDRSGQQLVNTRLPAGSPLPRSPAPREMWQTLDAGRRHVCDLVRGAVVPAIVCVDQGIAPNPRPQFAITIVFRPETFQGIITRQNVADGELASLVDRQGIVIWRNIRPEHFVGRQANGQLLSRLKGPEAEGSLESQSLENVRMLTAYRRSSISGWSVIVGLPLSQLEASDRSAILQGSLLSLAVLLIGCIFALILGRRLTNGLRSLGHVLDPRREGEPPPATGLAEFDAAASALQRASAERARSDRLQQMLIGELNHRVKNTLAIVQSLAHQTFRGASPEAGSVKAFEARLLALGEAHNLLTREGWISAPLPEIVQSALAPFCLPGRCELSGPNASIAPQMAVSLALALHELATNAVKYGALSQDKGVVSVTWTVSDGVFELMWRERDGPPVEKPTREGFGTRLIKRSLPAQLEGEATLEYPPTGVVCRLVGKLADPREDVVSEIRHRADRP